MTFHAYAVQEPATKLKPFTYEAKDLGPHDLELKITHCGICHSDLHLMKNDWLISQYPLVPGHEIIGIIQSKGKEVSHFEVGQRVGIGWQRSACLQCESCLEGEEAICAYSQATCNGHFGGYADFIRADSRFAFAIPDELSSEGAAPLLCGGITVFTPFIDLNIQAHHKVAIIGMGGLGHLALKFAQAWGCEVTLFSSTKSKEAEAKRLGAKHFVDSTDVQALSEAASSQDFILNTANVDLDWVSFLNILKPKGTLTFLGMPPNMMSFPAFLLAGKNRKICGSVTGSRSTIRTMLDFCARNKIEAQVEVMPMTKVNEALEKLSKNQARYRLVLKN